MATQALHSTFPVRNAPATQQLAKKPLLLRIFEFIVEAQTRRAEQEIARYMGARGLKFTDEVEREAERRFLSSHSKF